jgi:hypothetical protein
VFGGKVTSRDKRALKEKLNQLSHDMNKYLAADGYNIDLGDEDAFASWRASHQPFHWFAEFYGVMNEGGFDVVIGNPPYKALSVQETRQFIGYSTTDTKNLYPLVMERCDGIVNKLGRQGYIVPVSSVSTDGYASLQKIIKKRNLHYSSFDDRPSKLFDGLEHIRLTIHLIGYFSDTPMFFSTTYHKWKKEERTELFYKIRYSLIVESVTNALPKIGDEIEIGIINKLIEQKHTLAEFCVTSSSTEGTIHYSRKTGYFLVFSDFVPEVYDGNNERRSPSESKQLACYNKNHIGLIIPLLNSSLFFWFFIQNSDARHINKREIGFFPINLQKLKATKLADDLCEISDMLMFSYKEKAESKNLGGLLIQMIYPRKSKDIIDEIDVILAKYYGFTDEELDFIINYDIKYRMGGADDE